MQNVLYSLKANLRGADYEIFEFINIRRNWRCKQVLIKNSKIVKQIENRNRLGTSIYNKKNSESILII